MSTTRRRRRRRTWSFQGGRSVPTRCKSKKYRYYLNCTVCGNDDPFTWKKDSSISRQNATTCCFDDGSFFTIGGGSAQQWLFHLCRIFAFLDHVKEGVDIGRDYNVPKWADIMILACDSNRFNRVKQVLQDENLQRILKSLFLVTDACLVWAPC